MTHKLNKSRFDESQISLPEELDFVKSIKDPDRQEVVACSIIKHRRPDKLSVNDPVPALELTCLNQTKTAETVSLDSVKDQPLVLFFGSYT